MDQMKDYNQIQDAHRKLDERNTKEEQVLEAAALKARRSCSRVRFDITISQPSLHEIYP